MKRESRRRHLIDILGILSSYGAMFKAIPELGIYRAFAPRRPHRPIGANRLPPRATRVHLSLPERGARAADRRVRTPHRLGDKMLNNAN